MLTRRSFLRGSLGGLALTMTARIASATGSAISLAGSRDITVYKDAGCDCCRKWIAHLVKAGFRVTGHDSADMAAVKASFGVPAALQSCHTATVGGYVIEGHVPASVISRLLIAKPKVLGLAVPGMPMGSPGMEGPFKEKYDVIAFAKGGKTRVYA